MRILFESKRYEMTLVDGLKFHALYSWFPVRRLLRAIKRVVLSGKNWLPTVAVFLPMCIAVYGLMCRFGLLTPSSAIVELVSIALGSIILLFIKETLDEERRRNRTLKTQYSKLMTWAYDSCDIYHQLCASAGIDAELASPKRYPEGTAWSYGFGGYAIVSSAMQPLHDRLRRLIDEIYEDADKFDFIDWKRSEMDWHRRMVLDSLSRLDGDIQITAEEMQNFFQYICDILLAVNRLWSYQIDRARTELLRRLVERCGAEMEW